MRESKIEKKVTEFAQSLGWLAYKWKSVNQRGVPDKIYFKNGRVIIIEFKATDKEPSKKQIKVHKRLRKEGFEVYVVDDIEEGKRIFTDIAAR